MELLRELRGRNVEIRVIAPQQTGTLGVNPNCLEDIHGSFRAIYGMKGDFLCLIRPDGHIGLFQQKIDLVSLRSYLDLIGPQKQNLKEEEPLCEMQGAEIDASEFVEVDDPGLSAVRLATRQKRDCVRFRAEVSRKVAKAQRRKWDNDPAFM